MANVVVNIGKDIEVGAEDLLSWLTKGQTAVDKAAPNVLATLGTLFGALDKVLNDAQAGAQNPILALINAPAEIADIKAAWPAVKSFLATLGVKV